MEKVLARRMRDDLLNRRRFINPANLASMEPDEVILVNVIRLNSKLVECEVKRINNDDVEKIRYAMRGARGRKGKSRRALMNAKMRIGDVLRIFPEHKTLPKNSFAKLE